MTNKPLLLAEAVTRMVGAATCSVGKESVALHDAHGRVLADSIAATLDVPPWDNSAMDGYAVQSSDAGKALPVSQRVFAGDFPEPQTPNSCCRLFTGAPLPPGTDAVVPQEQMEILDDKHVRVPADVKPGQHIRRQGADVKVGDILLQSGSRLRPADLGVLASQGLAQLAVRRPLQVAVINTGDELREPGTGSLELGSIYNSNSPMLCSTLESWGCEVSLNLIVRDSLTALREALKEAARCSDLIIASGGASVGEADLMRDALTDLGQIEFWRIAIKPGKPFTFGFAEQKPLIGLPGNPVSAYITLLLVARPFVHLLQGRSPVKPRTLMARAGFSVSRPRDRLEFLRVELKSGPSEFSPPTAHLYPDQSSGVLRSLSVSDALAEVPIGTIVEEGEWIKTLPLDGFLW
ncbi:MAG: gephyrin-like molybdotransferase Glp [Pseudomonadota bacterium]